MEAKLIRETQEMRQITVEPPAKVRDGKVVIPIQFPTFRVNLTIEEADKLCIDLIPAIVAAGEIRRATKND